jgi:hypothetical protein
MSETILINEDGFIENILVLDDFIPKSYCDLFIKTFNQHNELRIESYVEGKDKTDVEEVSYKKICVSDIPDENFVNFIATLMSDLYIQYREVLVARFAGDENCLLGLPELDMYDIDLPIMKKYEPNGNDHFGPHCDTYMRGWDDSNTLKINRNYRFLNILFYLNDVEEGGETEFYFADKNVKVKPKTGRVVVFPPFWTHIHAGLRPISGTKYIMNGYLRHKIADKEFAQLSVKTGNDLNIATVKEGVVSFPYSQSNEEHF